MAIELTTATATQLSGIRQSLGVESTKKHLASRVLTNDTQIIKNSIVLDNWQTTASGLRYHPIPFTDPLTKTTANLSANFGMSYNGQTQFTFINSNNNSVINTNFGFDLFTNIDYVEPSTPRFNYGTGTAGSAPVHTITTVLTASDGFIVGGYFSGFIDSDAISLAKCSYLGEVFNWPVNKIFSNSGVLEPVNVKKIARDLDGNIVIGGYFSQQNNLQPNLEISSNSLIKLNPNDGSIITSFSSLNILYQGPPIINFDIDSNDKVIAIGNIYKYGDAFLTDIGPQSNEFHGGIFRLNSDGSFDSTFNIGGYFAIGGYNYPSSILIQDDNKIVVGARTNSGSVQLYTNGSFNQDFYNLIRFNEDGTIDSSFNTAVGGYITEFIEGHPVPPRETFTNNARIAENNSRVDIRKIINGLNGDLIIGGYFTSVGGYQCFNLTKLDSNGNANFIGNSEDNFRPQLPQNPPNGSRVNDILLQDGKIIVVGRFQEWISTQSSPAVPVNNIVRLNYDGTIDETFVTSVSGFIGSSGEIFSVTMLPEDKILITGQFNRYHNKVARNMAVLNSDGTYDGIIPDKFVRNTTQSLLAWNSIYQRLSIGGYGSNFGIEVQNVNNQISIVSQTYPINFAIMDYSIISTYGGIKAGDGTVANSGSGSGSSY